MIVAFDAGLAAGDGPMARRARVAARVLVACGHDVRWVRGHPFDGLPGRSVECWPAGGYSVALPGSLDAARVADPDRLVAWARVGDPAVAAGVNSAESWALLLAMVIRHGLVVANGAVEAESVR